MKNINKNLLLLLSITTLLFASCQNDDIPQSGYYTFTGQTVRDYLQTSETYSIFNDFVEHSTRSKLGANVPSLLGAYGYYTVFAPNDSAMTVYMKDQLNCSSLDEIYATYSKGQADSIVNLVTGMHVVSSGHNQMTYEVKSFTRKLPDRNLQDKVVYIESSGDTYMINEMALITEKDVVLHNGVLHGVDRVIEPSDMKLADFFETYPQYSLFGKLMEQTGLIDDGRILTDPESDYELDPRDYSQYKGAAATIEVPTTKKQFYTVFIETNDVFGRDIPAVAEATTLSDSIEAVKAYAREWYEREFRDATDEERAAALTDEWDNPYNYLNRFVAYHIINMKVDRVDFTRYKVGMDRAYNRMKEFYETLAPAQEIYLSSGANGHPWETTGELTADPDPDMVVLNPNPESEDFIYNAQKDWGRPVRYVAAVGTRTLTTENGFFHELQNVLYYPRRDFKRIRFRHDFSGTMFPEIMSNDFRYKYMNTGYIVLPQQPYQYASNIHFISEQTIQIQTSPNTGSPIGSWNSNLGDEMMFSGTYDFILRLPPVPAGTYEIRLGYVSAPDRGCAQFYLGSDENCNWETKNFDGMIAAGIPIDLTVSFLNQMGRAEADAADGGKTQEEIRELDKEWYVNGRMKAMNSILGANGNDTSRSLRDILTGHNPSRRIIGHITLNKDGCIYMRARSLTTEPTVRLGADYIEIVPDNIYNNPYILESRD